MYDNGAKAAGAASEQLNYRYEAARDRQREHRGTILNQIERLSNILDPVLEGDIPSIGKDSGAVPGHPSKLLQDLNSDADNLEYISGRLESLIQRIRL